MTTSQWANTGPDEGALPALLLRVRDHVPVTLIDFLWIFPPRRIAAGESVVLVIAAFADEPDRRRVITAHFTIARNRKGQAFVDALFDEHGSAPANAIGRIVDGVLHRLGEDADTSLRVQQIGGDAEQWDTLISELGGTPQPAAAATAEPAAQPDETDQTTTPPPHADNGSV